MSVVGVWAKGRGHAHDKVVSVARYIPRPRVPWQPSRFSRKNLTKDDLIKMWGQGRYRTGYGNRNSGYSTEKTMTLEDNSISIIPKHELEKYMPDISLGPKALVTPVSLMSARNGHRVTHDMLHSYDAHIGGLEKVSVVDHDNITPQDTVHFAGLNAAALDCRSRIYRWLRRGPFFQEDQYFRRYITAGENAPVIGTATVAPPQETTLFRKIVRLAAKGNLKLACEEYRKITSVPPVEVFRALTAACAARGNLADALSIFEDGNTKLFYVARDGEVLLNLMNAAIATRNRPRVVWVYNVMRGRHFENVFARAEIDPVMQYDITVRGLVFLLDEGCAEEARVLYDFLDERQMLTFDLQKLQGQQLRKALAEGQPVGLANGTATPLDELPRMKDARALAPRVRETISRDMGSRERELHSASASSVTMRNEDDSVRWLEEEFSDVNVLAILRLARHRGRKDLMKHKQDEYVKRCISWLYTLSISADHLRAKPLQYLRKSKPSVAGENIRVAWIPEMHAKTRLLPTEDGCEFFYKRGARFVAEVFPARSSLPTHQQYLVVQPKHVEVSAGVDFAAKLPSGPSIRVVAVPPATQIPIQQTIGKRADTVPESKATK